MDPLLLKSSSFSIVIDSSMAHYTWVVKALSPRDGGWVRTIGSFRGEHDAWEAIEYFWLHMVLAGDYLTVTVVKTIAFCIAKA